jgi:hypothetical protein
MNSILKQYQKHKPIYMVQSVILELAYFLYGGGDTVDAPRAVPQIVTDFDSLKKLVNPNPKFADNLDDNKKKLVTVAIYNRMLATQEGEALIKDLVTIKKKNGIKLTFFVNITHPGDNSMEAGFCDVLDEMDNLKQDIGIYFKIQPPADPNALFTFDEDRYDITEIRMASSRTSITIFHELLHVWFFYMEFDDTAFRSGHAPGPSSGSDYDERFKDRMDRYRDQLKQLEQNLKRKP